MITATLAAPLAFALAAFIAAALAGGLLSAWRDADRLPLSAPAPAAAPAPAPELPWLECEALPAAPAPVVAFRPRFVTAPAPAARPASPARTRRDIAKALIRGARTVREVTACVPVSRRTVARHLTRLLTDGLAERDTSGRAHKWSPTPRAVDVLGTVPGASPQR